MRRRASPDAGDCGAGFGCERSPYHATELFTHAISFGGAESTLERRKRWTEESDEVPESLVRLNIGCEHVEDLWHDLENALERSRP